MQCPECQFDNREGVKFCEECGSEFEFECPACKANIPRLPSYKIWRAGFYFGHHNER